MLARGQTKPSECSNRKNVEIRGEAKINGNQLKEIKIAIQNQGIQSSPAAPKSVDAPQTQQKVLKKRIL